MNLLVILSAIVAVVYVATATARVKELPESISALVYSLRRPYQFLWTLWVWVVTFLLTPPILSAMEDSAFQFLGFITVAALAFCGAMPLVRGQRNTGHYVCALIAAVLSQLCVMFICPYFLLLWGVFIILYLCAPFCDVLDGKGVFILECVCWTTITAALMC